MRSQNFRKSSLKLACCLVLASLVKMSGIGLLLAPTWLQANLVWNRPPLYEYTLKKLKLPQGRARSTFPNSFITQTISCEWKMRLWTFVSIREEITKYFKNPKTEEFEDYIMERVRIFQIPYNYNHWEFYEFLFE